MKKLWFKRKSYGYGWTPSSKEGWLTVIIYVVSNVVNFYAITDQSSTPYDTVVVYVAGLLVSTTVLIFICIAKGEKPKWQWGKVSGTTPDTKD